MPNDSVSFPTPSPDCVRVTQQTARQWKQDREPGSSSARVPGSLTPEVTAGADLVVTFGCSVDDVVGDVLVEDWALVDDDGQPLRDYDQIRDGIRSRVEILAERLSDGPAAFLGRGPSPDKYRSALSDDLRKRGLAHR